MLSTDIDFNMLRLTRIGSSPSYNECVDSIDKALGFYDISGLCNIHSFFWGSSRLRQSNHSNHGFLEVKFHNETLGKDPGRLGILGYNFCLPLVICFPYQWPESYCSLTSVVYFVAHVEEWQ